MKRIYMVVILALAAISANAQLKDNNLYTQSVKTFSLEDKYVNPNGEALIAAALRGDVKKVDEILKKVPFMVNDPLTVYPKMKSAQPLMCELINQGKKEVINVFFKHGFVKNHKCPNGKGQTDVMTLLEKNPNMYCYLLSQKKYPTLYDRLAAQIKKGANVINLPCLDKLMGKDYKIASAVFNVAKKENSTAIKLAVRYIVKNSLELIDIGLDQNMIARAYVKTGDRSLIDPLYDKSLFTASQWNQIATDALRENSFAQQMLTFLLSTSKCHPTYNVDKQYERFVDQMANMPPAKDVHIYNIIRRSYVNKHNEEEERQRQNEKREAEEKHQAWLKEFGENAPAGLAKKFRWAEKGKFHAYYYPSGVRIAQSVGDITIKDYKAPVVVVVKQKYESAYEGETHLYSYKWIELEVYNMKNEKIFSNRQETYDPSKNYHVHLTAKDRKARSFEVSVY